MNNSEKHLSELSESFKGNVLTKIAQNVASRFSFLCPRIHRKLLQKTERRYRFPIGKDRALQS